MTKKAHSNDTLKTLRTHSNDTITLRTHLDTTKTNLNDTMLIRMSENSYEIKFTIIETTKLIRMTQN